MGNGCVFMPRPIEIILILEDDGAEMEGEEWDRSGWVLLNQRPELTKGQYRLRDEASPMREGNAEVSPLPVNGERELEQDLGR